jgi:hypothetical protein
MPAGSRALHGRQVRPEQPLHHQHAVGR